MNDPQKRLEDLVSQRLADATWDARMARRVFHVRRARKIRLALVLGALVMVAGLGGAAAGWDQYRSGEISEIWSPTGMVSVVSWGE